MGEEFKQRKITSFKKSFNGLGDIVSLYIIARTAILANGRVCVMVKIKIQSGSA